MSRTVRSAVALAALALFAGCTHFIPAAEAPDAPIPAGKPTRLTLRAPPPEGVEVRWEAGDGSPPIVGAEFVHTWHRPGRYTVRVSSKDGVSEQAIEVQSRQPLELVPDDVDSAVVVPRFFLQFNRVLEIVQRVTPDAPVEELLRQLERQLGVRPSAPETLVAAGLDPAEGLVVLRLPQDPEGTWILVGALEPDKAMALGARIFGVEDPQPNIVEGLPFVIAEGGRRAAYGMVGGYLAMRPGAQVTTDLEQVFAHLALQPSGTLAGVDAWKRARANAPGEDAAIYARLPQLDRDGVRAALAMGLSLSDEEVTATLSLPLASPEREELLGAAGNGSSVPELARRLPREGLGFLSVALEPRKLLEAVVRDPGQRAMFDLVTAQKLGQPLSTILSAFTGNLVAAFFFDGERTVRALVEPEATPAALPPTLLILELASRPKAREALLQLLRTSPKLSKVRGRGEAWEIEGARIAVEGDRLLIAIGAPELASRPGGGEAYGSAVGPELLAKSGQIVFHTDLRRTHDLVAATPPPTDLDPAYASMYVGQLAAKLEVMRVFDDLLLHVRTTEEGLAGGLRIRFRREPVAAPPAPKSTAPEAPAKAKGKAARRR